MAAVGVVLVWHQESSAKIISHRNICPFSDLKCTNARGSGTVCGPAHHVLWPEHGFAGVGKSRPRCRPAESPVS
jgi:hypothetical protein